MVPTAVLPAAMAPLDAAAVVCAAPRPSTLATTCAIVDPMFIAALRPWKAVFRPLTIFSPVRRAIKPPASVTTAVVIPWIVAGSRLATKSATAVTTCETTVTTLPMAVPSVVQIDASPIAPTMLL